MNEGDYLQDVTGPLGCPTTVEGDRVVVIGGGVGLAIAYPVARMLCEQGKHVSVIMGARTKDLLILTEQFEALPLEHLYITTDDGTAGEQAWSRDPRAHLPGRRGRQRLLRGAGADDDVLGPHLREVRGPP